MSATGLRELSIGEVLDIAIKIYWRNASTLLRIVVFVVAPARRAGVWRSSVQFALRRRVHSVIWVTFLGAFLAVLGLLFLIIPGVWLWVSFAVAVPVLLTEGIKGRRALGRSRRLVKGHIQRTAGPVSALVAVVQKSVSVLGVRERRRLDSGGKQCS